MNRFESIMRSLDATPVEHKHQTDGRQISEAEIVAAEEMIESRLPAEFREFIRDFGAFEVEASFAYPSGETGFVRFFLGILPPLIPEPKSHEEWEADSHFNLVKTCVWDSTFSNFWRREWLTIVVGHSDIALVLSGEDCGAIFAFDKENHAYKIANSFGEFLSSLKKVPNPERSQKSRAFWLTFSTR